MEVKGQDAVVVRGFTVTPLKNEEFLPPISTDSSLSLLSEKLFSGEKDFSWGHMLHAKLLDLHTVDP